MTTYGESMNTRVPPFDNVEIRRAVAAAIDREHYVAHCPDPDDRATQPIPPGSIAGYDPAFVGQRYDYAAALEHMRKAGYPFDPATGRGGWPAPIDYLLYETGAVTLTAPLLQQDLAKIGLRLRLKVVSWSSVHRAAAAPGRRRHVARQQHARLPRPERGLRRALHDDLDRARGLAEHVVLLEPAGRRARRPRARLELDPARRRDIYRAMDAIVCDDAPWAFTFGFHYYDVRQGYVRGFRPHPVWPLDLGGVWLDRTADAAARVLGGGLR